MTAFPHDPLHPTLRGAHAIHGREECTIRAVELEGDAPTDESLMMAHQSGDPTAFPMLVERYKSDLHRYLQRFLGSSAAADDVFQETFLQIHLSAASFDPNRKLRPWLYTIASNKARDWYRHHRRRAAASLDKPMGRDDGEFTLLDVVKSSTGKPGDSISAREESAQVKRVVDGLPELHREILLMAYFQRFSYQHIAETLGIPLGTVKSRLHSAVAHFADSWTRTTHETRENHS
jgi:RNA polymerase sigma-70 factor (ECF subfamily)